MAGIKDITNVWKNIKEIDLKPIRDGATRPLKIAMVGAEGAGKHALAEQMRTDLVKPGVHSQTTMALITPEAASDKMQADLIIVVVNASKTDYSAEQAMVKRWSEAGNNILVFINTSDLADNTSTWHLSQIWAAPKVVSGSLNDLEFIKTDFIPAILDLLPQEHIALGRQFPLFRLTVARQLINETCFSNAAYSFSTGLAEIVPVLDLPLNLTDMIVLTKSQGFLAYKLGLLLGFSTRWQDYVTEFGSVIGSGFLWRQLARSLIGLVPGWGIIPKVVVAYSGTYVVGNAILGWYLTGRKLSPQQMRGLYSQAMLKGRDYARKLSEKLPKPKKRKGSLPAGQKEPALASGDIVIDKDITLSPAEASTVKAESAPAAIQEASEELHGEAGKSARVKKELRPARKLKISWLKKKAKAIRVTSRVCENCGRSSAADATFCQYCGMQLGD